MHLQLLFKSICISPQNTFKKCLLLIRILLVFGYYWAHFIRQNNLLQQYVVIFSKKSCSLFFIFFSATKITLKLTQKYCFFFPRFFKIIAKSNKSKCYRLMFMIVANNFLAGNADCTTIDLRSRTSNANTFKFSTKCVTIS